MKLKTKSIQSESAREKFVHKYMLCDQRPGK